MYPPQQAPNDASMMPTMMDGEQVQQPQVETQYSNDIALLELFDKKKRECQDLRWVWEREWLRDLNYVAGRQWIMYHPTRREWLDKRLAKWIPRPVTQKAKETVQTLRAALGAIDLTIKASPVSSDVNSVATAEIADQIESPIREEHDMSQVMRESDFWYLATGNTCLQISWDIDTRFNRRFIQSEQCQQCGAVYQPQEIQQAQGMCPNCGGQQFTPAIGPDGKEVGQWLSHGRGKTTALSPFEYMVPPNVTRWDELPYLIRIRWRDKNWVEANLPDLMGRVQFGQTTSDRSLQIFKSLAMANDSSAGSQWSLGVNGQSDGVTEYELWMKPTPDYPKGLVLRVMGDQNPVVVRKEDEALPGPIPFTDIEGNVLFPFVFAQYEHTGGRLYGTGALAPVIQKFDQLNQLDSLVQLCLQRTANPIWIVEAASGVEHFSGEPGLIMTWQSHGGTMNTKPERIEGSNIPAYIIQWREMLLRDIEEQTGTFDILKGQKPAGVEAFSAMQLLVERSQSRLTSAFQARGEMYRKWFSIALELERSYGPDQRTWAVIGPSKGYTFKHFENAQLQGQISLKIEDGSNQPKTPLGKRAAIQHASQLQLLNVADPEVQQGLLREFGLTDLIPTLNFHVQTALQIQDGFEQWLMQGGMGTPPLAFKPWYKPEIHYIEHVKWLNTDRMKELLSKNPMAEQMIAMYLQGVQMLIPPMMPAGGGGGQAGAGQSLANSNRNSGSPNNLPKGNSDTGNNGQNVGPA